ncbi:MAG: hypothetical protein D6734_02280 [Candidatus Schekmanbacteria bacterium]|nr:MAG: hypothetical protein D6734_02280 [Candidatus Schekmanbacteria bacterium]
MSIRKIIIILFLISFAFPLCVSADKEITVLFTSSTRNTFLACGCPGNPFGGLSQRAFMVEKIRKEKDDVLLLDGGDIFPVQMSSFEKRKLPYILQAYSILHYDAVIPGEADLGEGLEFLLKEINEKNIPFISTTIFSKRADSLVFPPYLIKELNNVKVAVISLTLLDEEALKSNGLSNEIRINDNPSRIQQYINYLKKRADIIIALSHSSIVEAIMLTRKFPEISFVIEGHYESDYPHRSDEGRVPVFNAGKEGEYLGRLLIHLDAKNKITKIDDEFIAMSKLLPSHRKTEELFLSYLDRVKKDTKEGERIPELEAYRQGLWNFYSSNDKCIDCHSDQYEQWIETPHSRAFDALVNAGREYDPECLYCHTTGYGRDGGFINYEKTPEMISVGCTSCHGVDKKHPNSNKEPMTVSQKICIVCHTKDKDPAFSYEDFILRIIH